MKPKIKNILIFSGIFVIIITLYFVFFNKPATKPGLVSATTGQPVANKNNQNKTSVIAKEFLAQLLNIKSLELNTSIFTTNSFSSLKDTTDNSLILSSPDDKGRLNPFSPVGSDGTIIQPVVPVIQTPINTQAVLQNLNVNTDGNVNPPVGATQ